MSFAQNIQKGTDKNGKLCLEKDGKVIVKEKFDIVFPYNKEAGLIPAKLKGKWGFYDNNGKLVIKHKYELLFGPPDTEKWFAQERMEVQLKGKKFLLIKQEKIFPQILQKFTFLKKVENLEYQ